MFCTFLLRFCELLDAEDPTWRDQSLLMLDGASYHTSAKTIDALKALRVPTCFLAPYQFDISSKYSPQVLDPEYSQRKGLVLPEKWRPKSGEFADWQEKHDRTD